MSGMHEDSVALVTGAGSGIGRAAAEIFAREGARVVVADRNAEAGNETVEIIRKAGDRAIAGAVVKRRRSLGQRVGRAVVRVERIAAAHEPVARRRGAVAECPADLLLAQGGIFFFLYKKKIFF